MGKFQYRTVKASFSLTADAPVQKVSGAHDLSPILRDYFAAKCDPSVEQFVVVSLDVRMQVIGIDTVTKGILTACLVHSREVFRCAILHGAAAVAVAHNHPSGDPEPSEEDEELTRQLRKAGDVLGIPVIDSLVITGREWRSV